MEFIKRQIDFFFFGVNKTPDMFISALWEILKAYIGGEIISGYERKIKKDKMMTKHFTFQRKSFFAGRVLSLRHRPHNGNASEIQIFSL